MRLAFLMRDEPKTTHHGLSTYCQEVTKALENRGHQIKWFVGGGEIETHRLGAKIPDEFDLVYVVSLPYGDKVRLPMVAKCNSPLKEEGKYFGGFKKIQAWFGEGSEIDTLNRAKAVISVSHTSHDILLNKYNAESIVIPDGVDLERFNPEKKDGIPNAMVCTRDEPRKNFPLVREAMKHCGGRMSWSLALGEWSQRQLESQFREADIFLTTSLSEGFNQALLQGMASGCACLASDIPAHRELIDDGRNGMLFQDKVQMKRCLDLLIDDRGYRDSLGRQARKKAEGYPWSRNAIETEAVFKGVLK